MEFGRTDQNPHGIWMDWDPLVFEGPVSRTEKNGQPNTTRPSVAVLF